MNPPSESAALSAKPALHVRLLARFLKGFFHLLYHPLAPLYDLVAALVSLGQWKNWGTSILPYIQSGPVLELGFGPGHLQLALRSTFSSVTGIDESPQMARLTQRRLRRTSTSTNQSESRVPALVRGRAEQLPFQNGYFSTLVATFPTPYIIHPSTVAEAWRVLVPGGRLLILASACITGRSLLARLAAWLFRVTGQVPPQELPLALWQEPLHAAGFQTELLWLDSAGARLLLVRATKATA